jgi:hypothetical protein
MTSVSMVVREAPDAFSRPCASTATTFVKVDPKSTQTYVDGVDGNDGTR